MTDQIFPTDRGYTRGHEWVDIAPGGGIPERAVRVGLSFLAVDALGEIVFLQLPEPGTELTAGQMCGEVESTKSVSELLSPVTGTVESVNAALDENPSLVNEDPHGRGWLFTATVTGLGVLSVDEYRCVNGG